MLLPLPLQGGQVLVRRAVSVPLLLLHASAATAAAAVSVRPVLPLPHATSAAASVPVWPAVLLLHDAPSWPLWHAASPAASASAVPLPLPPVPLHAATAAVPVRPAVPLHAPAPPAAVSLPLLHDGATWSLWHASPAPAAASGTVHARRHDAAPAAAPADDEPVLPDASILGQVPAHGHVVSSDATRRLHQLFLPFVPSSTGSVFPTIA